MTVKRYILILAASLGLAVTANANAVVDGAQINNLRMERNGEFMLVSMNINLNDLNVESNRAVLFTPSIVNGQDTLSLRSVGVYGRTRYYHYLRNGGMITGETERSFRASQKPDTLNYQVIVPYKEWMEGSMLVFDRDDYGCCKALLSQQRGILFNDFRTPEVAEVQYFPLMVYVRPQAEKVKTRSLSGQAYIDFPVNKMRIYPEYRKNPIELAKIEATIDSVKNDKDITITALSIKGYASPESPYSNNTRLAKGRTAALKAHVENLYKFGKDFIKTSYEPEDWAGLRAYVEKSNLANKDAILALIDSDREPDNKEYAIKSRFPKDYRFLLDYCYPALRHSDYKIEYVIRSFTDIDEIKRVLKTQPQKLSLNEFYQVAETYEPGSEEFNEVFDIAVRMYPDDPIANLNEANTAMQREDLVTAKRYLDKAGDSPEAAYARGAYAAMNKDYDTAERLLLEAQKAGIEEAAITLEQVREMKSRIK